MKRSQLDLSGFQPQIVKPVVYSQYLLSYPGSSVLHVQFISRATEGGWNTLKWNSGQCRPFVNTTKGRQFLIHWGYHNLQPPAITQAIGLRTLTANTGIPSQVSPYRLCCEKMTRGKVFLGVLGFPSSISFRHFLALILSSVTKEI